MLPVKQPGGKVVHAFAVEGDCDPASIKSNTVSIEWPPRSGRRQDFPEIDRGEWFGLEEASLKGRVPNDVEKASRGSEYVGLGSGATPDFGGYQDMGRPVKRDPEATVRLRSRGHGRQAASSAVGAGIVNARAMSCQPSSFRKQICPEATRP